MRIQSTVTSLSWIPSEAVPRPIRLVFDSGVTHYDAPPPASVEDLDSLGSDDRYRFANRLSAWIDVEGDRIVDYGYDTEHSHGTMGSTTVRLGPARTTFRAVALPDIRHVPEVGNGWIRFVQTTGGRTGLPAPRLVPRRPFVQFRAPLVWTSLALTLHADGRSQWELTGASPFPRHWVYDASHCLVAKAATTRYRRWWRRSFGRFTPWGAEDSTALVTAAESSLERELSACLMHSTHRPRLETVAAGSAIIEQDAADDNVLLLLDGVARIDADGRRIVEVGPGAILGERAGLETGRRTATVTAVTSCRVAVVEPDRLPRPQLAALARAHHRES
jgi:hypothetical protein